MDRTERIPERSQPVGGVAVTGGVTAYESGRPGRVPPSVAEFVAAATWSGDRLSTVVSPTWGAGADRRGAKRARARWRRDPKPEGRRHSLTARDGQRDQ